MTWTVNMVPQKKWTVTLRTNDTLAKTKACNMPLLVKHTLLFLSFLFFENALQASGKVSVYVSAHQDDWQLFMGVNAYDDIAGSSDSSRVIIIYVTSGDYSDCINASDTETVPYFLAREQGAKNSVELAANSHKQRFIWKNDTVISNGHLLIRSAYRFVNCYFIRLADGAINGQRNISLKNFRRNRFANNYSIDSLTYYKDWNDLLRTCESVLMNEIRVDEQVELHLFDTSQVYNPQDHSDHYEAGLLFMSVLNDKPVKRIFHEGYSSGRIERTANLNDLEIMKESGLFAAYNQAMMDNNYPSIWNNEYLRFCDNNYSRLVSGDGETHTTGKKTAVAIFMLFVLLVSLAFYKTIHKPKAPKGN